MSAMSDIASRFPHLSPLKQALLALQEMKVRLDEAEGMRTGPIAVVGIGCRFPGDANSPDEFWQLLREGRDAVVETPEDRWNLAEFYSANPDDPGRMATRHGGFLRRVDLFDAEFFGISPREAENIDPQQRLALEAAWEAVEDAGYAPGGLSGSRTGVFLGITGDEYAQRFWKARDLSRFDIYFASGIARSIAAGRISYVLGLNGPTLVVDTACSSSLVAVHQACQSLRLGECRMALAGGVNVVLSAETTLAFSKARMMAPDGRCKTFDAAADGFVRGEGCGILVLKRLSDAIADGDPIRAVISASAINQDGRSSGLTAPSGPAQQGLLRKVLADAGMEGGEVQYVEAHGTGTALGDPIEVQALAAVLGKGRGAKQPLLIGSVKTNLGHLESAAGVAGLIKTILAMEHGEIPPHLHFHTLNPHIELDGAWVEVPTSLRPWPEGKKRVAGVSSFGFSGTNAHVIVESAPMEKAAERTVERPLHLFTLSGR
ncbi:MAG TPA: polyketide synthase, partial [Bryobacteraceae bacterium]|nr:polyketide synthase [Bryobacteraceae bacterium]